MYHEISIVGNLGGDPEMRYTPDGTPVTNFSVAANRRWTNSDGSRGEETVWFRVTAWKRQAETCAQYLKKGRQVFVKGTLKPDKATGQPRIWTGQDGVARSSYEITAKQVLFLGGRNESVNEEDGLEAGSMEDEIPF